MYSIEIAILHLFITVQLSAFFEDFLSFLKINIRLWQAM